MIIPRRTQLGGVDLLSTGTGYLATEVGGREFGVFDEGCGSTRRRPLERRSLLLRAIF